jgi:hypothetical protein
LAGGNNLDSETNILPLLCPKGCDSYELEQVLVGKYCSSSGDRSDPQILLFPGDETRYAVKLIFDKKHRLRAVIAGPLLTDSALSELISQIERQLHTPAARIGNRVLFAALPVTGAFRFKDDFQILPVPENAPRPDFLMADHPFLLQFRFGGSENLSVQQMRMESRARELEMLLVALVANHIHGQRQISHQWVIRPLGDPPRRPRSILCQLGYMFEDSKALVDQFTSITDIPALTFMPPVLTYAQFAVSAGANLLLPDNIEAAIVAYGRLPAQLQTKFINASYWLQHSHSVFQDSRSASYLALVSAVEALMPPPDTGATCPSCKRSVGNGPTRQFKDFLEEFAPTGEQYSGELQHFYEIRSSLAHGGKVLLSDRHFSLGGLENHEDWMRQRRLHEMLRVAIVNWLFKSASEHSRDVGTKLSGITNSNSAMDCEAVARFCLKSLDLRRTTLPDAYFYACLSLCVIDAVFSIGVRYEGVRNVVQRYCEIAGFDRHRTTTSGNEPESLKQLVGRIEEHGPAWFGENVLRNRQRTSTRNGILKSEAVLQFSRVLLDHGVESLRDLQSADVQAIESEILKIPGQRSGISFKYFLMLSGTDELIKPDRMVRRFLTAALNRTVEAAECQHLIDGAITILRRQYRHITPRLLDNLIWTAARDRSRRS